MRIERPFSAARRYESMTIDQLKADPTSGPVLQEMALQYLMQHDAVDFQILYSGQLDTNGFLDDRGAKRYKKPSDVLRSNEQRAAVIKMTLDKLAASGIIRRG